MKLIKVWVRIEHGQGQAFRYNLDDLDILHLFYLRY